MNRAFSNQPLGKTLETLAGNVLGAEWRVIRLLLSQWPQIVGEEYAKHSCPVGVKIIPHPEARDKARLTIRIPGALAPEFQMQERTILGRVNRLMGYDFVEKLVLEHKIAPPK